MEGIRDGRVREAVEAYTGDRYTQHSTGVADGVGGFVAFFEPFVERTPLRDIRIVRSIVDGSFVFVQVYQDLNNGEARWLTTDMFDTDANGKIVEHWDNMEPLPEGPNPTRASSSRPGPSHRGSARSICVPSRVRVVVGRRSRRRRLPDLALSVGSGSGPRRALTRFSQSSRSRPVDWGRIQRTSIERNKSVSTAIHLDELSKEFSGVKAVDGLTFDVQSGVVAGLLGPNGAGKSTTIRMLLGLIRPSSGSASVMGTSIEHPAAYAKRIGALIEAPAFYPKLTGRANLRTLAALEGQPRERIDEVLEIVGLDRRSDDQVREYSLGMKQRLGIASALLRDPDVLILDEPANGLDPAGIVEIRELLRALASEGKTVLVSSHLLAEIQAMVDQVVIINKGRLVFEGGLVGLLEEASREVVAVPERAEDLDRLHRILVSAGYDASVDGGAVHVHGAVDAAGELNRIAITNGVTLAELRVHAEDLEDVFLRMTSGEVER